MEVYTRMMSDSSQPACLPVFSPPCGCFPVQQGDPGFSCKQVIQTATLATEGGHEKRSQSQGGCCCIAHLLPLLLIPLLACVTLSPPFFFFFFAENLSRLRQPPGGWR